VDRRVTQVDVRERSSMIALRVGCAITPTRRLTPATLLIYNGRVLAIGTPDQVTIPSHAEIIAVERHTVVPGFIDTHVHGRGGVYFGEAAATTAALCRTAVATGVTSLLPTLAGLKPGEESLTRILARIAAVRQAMTQTGDGAEILGIHLEGPYLSGADAVRGSQREESLRQPAVDESLRIVVWCGAGV
jgi:N-acetylglucosamine-6-phosphate deacetylase